MMTLAKALKLKNQLVGQMTKAQGLIRQENLKREDDKRKFDVDALLAEYRGYRDRLTLLKTNIFQANAPIFPKIIKMGELKAEVAFLRSINTAEGKIEKPRRGWNDNSPAEEIEMVAHFDKVWVEDSIKEIEAQIVDLQDELDAFNATTKIDFE